MRASRFLPVLAGALLLVFFAAPALAVPMPLDGSWTVLDEFMPVGGFFSNSYDWVSPDNVAFTITDLFVVSDAFNVFDFGAPVFSTPLMPDWDLIGAGGAFDSPPYTTDPNVALATPAFSKGLWVFGAGAHSITIQDYHIPPMSPGGPPFGDGTVAFKASATPEPGTMGLMLLGGVALLALRRKA